MNLAWQLHGNSTGMVSNVDLIQSRQFLQKEPADVEVRRSRVKTLILKTYTFS